jgi:hypothetical protein
VLACFTFLFGFFLCRFNRGLCLPVSLSFRVFSLQIQFRPAPPVLFTIKRWYNVPAAVRHVALSSASRRAKGRHLNLQKKCAWQGGVIGAAQGTVGKNITIRLRHHRIMTSSYRYIIILLYCPCYIPLLHYYIIILVYYYGTISPHRCSNCTWP